MKILILGGTGLVGRAFDSINLFGKNIVRASSKHIDLLDRASTVNYIRLVDPDIIVNLAGYVGGMYKNKQKPVEFFDKNMLINMNVMHAARTVSTDIILISTLSTCIFPEQVEEYPMTADILHNGPPHHSNESYAYAKRMVDVLTRSYREQYGSMFITIAPGNLYGENDHFNDEGSHVIPGLIKKAMKAKITGEKFMVKGTGKPLRQFTYAKDLANAIIYIIDNFKAFDTNEPVIITNPQEISIYKAALLISDEFGIDHRDVVCEQPEDIIDDGQYKKTAQCNKRILENIKFTPVETGIQYVISDIKKSRIGVI